jgi:shikimate kinase
MKIFLIGMPGSGKSTLGKQLAQALNIPFVDLDGEIEKQEKLPIPELFNRQGETYFRAVESSLLYRWAESDKSFVMATGGGAPCFHDGMKKINQSGKSIFIDVPLSDLVTRAEKVDNRPLLKGDTAARLKALYENRRSVYQQASLLISGSDIKVESILKLLTNL